MSQPGQEGRQYRRATRTKGAAWRSADAFFDEAPVIEGSWWLAWSRWLREQSTGEVDARAVNESIAAAPGAYVRER